MNGRDCFDSSYPALQQPWCRCCRSRCRCGWWCVELWTFPGPLWSGWWCGTSWPPLPHWAPADRHSNNIKCEDWMKHVFVGFFFYLLFFCWSLSLLIHATRLLVHLSSWELMTITRSHSFLGSREKYVCHDFGHLRKHLRFHGEGNYRHHMVTRTVDTDLLLQTCAEAEQVIILCRRSCGSAGSSQSHSDPRGLFVDKRIWAIDWTKRSGQLLIGG